MKTFEPQVMLPSLYASLATTQLVVDADPTDNRAVANISLIENCIAILEEQEKEEAQAEAVVKLDQFFPTDRSGVLGKTFFVETKKAAVDDAIRNLELLINSPKFLTLNHATRESHLEQLLNYQHYSDDLREELIELRDA